MGRRNLWVFGLCLMLAGLVGMVGTARLSADVSISDREASQVWGGQYCTGQYTVSPTGCQNNTLGCPLCNTYAVPGITVCGPTLSAPYCLACTPGCLVKYVPTTCLQIVTQ
jgi:hypothetical protein